MKYQQLHNNRSSSQLLNIFMTRIISTRIVVLFVLLLVVRQPKIIQSKTTTTRTTSGVLKGSSPYFTFNREKRYHTVYQYRQQQRQRQLRHHHPHITTIRNFKHNNNNKNQFGLQKSKCIAFFVRTSTVRYYFNTISVPFICVQERLIRNNDYTFVTKQYYNRKNNKNNFIQVQQPTRRIAQVLYSTTTNSGYTMEVGSASICGSDPDRPQKVYQDSSFYFYLDNNENHNDNKKTTLVLGVLDGHGLKGHLVSDYLAKTALPNRIVQSLTQQSSNTDNNNQELLTEIKEKIHKIGKYQLDDFVLNDQDNYNEKDSTVTTKLINSFLLAQYDMQQNASIPSGRSGTTCIVCVINTSNGCIDTATVGDSRAILVTTTKTNVVSSSSSSDVSQTTKQVAATAETTHDASSLASVLETSLLSSSSSTVSSIVQVQQLTESTTVQIPTERQRIISCNGSRIDTLGNVFYGPIGIAMTRSLGNTVMLPAGVIPIPITSTDRFIYNETISFSNTTSTSSRSNKEEYCYYVCLGTDGIFDVLTNDRISEIIIQCENNNNNMNKNTKSNNMNQIAETICIAAKNKWINDLPIETKIDDITFIIVKITSNIENTF